MARRAAPGGSTGGTGGSAGAPGSTLWANVWGAAGNDEGLAITSDASGNVLVGGFLNGTVDLGCGPVASGASANAMFVVKLSPSGACLWNKVTGTSGASVTSLATDIAGNVYLGGGFAGSIDLGCGTQIATTDNDIVIAKLDPSGNCLWSDHPGGGQPASGPRVAVAGSGTVYAAGGFEPVLDFGAGPLISAGGTDIFVVALAPGDGTQVWSQRFGDVANQTALALASDTLGEVIVAGSFSGNLDLGSGVLSNSGPDDEGFAAKLTPAGATIWARPFADADDQIAQAVAVDPSTNQIVVAGRFNNVGAVNGWIAKLDLGGNDIWSRTVPSSLSADVLGVAVDMGGEIAYVTTFAPDVNGGAFISQGADDVLITKTNPAATRSGSGPSPGRASSRSRRSPSILPAIR